VKGKFVPLPRNES